MEPDKIEIHQKVVTYLDAHHLDVHRFFLKTTLSDWSICDNYSEMRENVEKFKEWIRVEFEVENFEMVMFIHTEFDEIIDEIIKFMKYKNEME